MRCLWKSEMPKVNEWWFHHVRLGSFGKIGERGQMLEPFDTALKVNQSKPLHFHVQAT